MKQLYDIDKIFPCSVQLFLLLLLLMLLLLLLLLLLLRSETVEGCLLSVGPLRNLARIHFQVDGGHFPISRSLPSSSATWCATYCIVVQCVMVCATVKGFGVASRQRIKCTGRWKERDCLLHVGCWWDFEAGGKSRPGEMLPECHVLPIILVPTILSQSKSM